MKIAKIALGGDALAMSSLNSSQDNTT